MADKKSNRQREIELYRDLLEKPEDFKEGFGWTTVAGILFCGLVMLPGSIYLGLMSGGNLGAAASWVTLILFNEVARRSLKTLNKQNLVILLHAAGVIMAANVLFPGGPFSQLVFRAYLVTSDAIRDSNMRDFFPTWFVPKPDSEAITERNLLHVDWLMPIAVLVFTLFIGLVRRYTLGYFFFRLTSDIEQLPYPMAAIQAQGAMAMAEADETASEEGEPGKAFFDPDQRKQQRKKSQRWRLFSLGATLGIAFGFLQVGIPALTGVFLDQRVFIIPQPFIDTTTLTESILPAAPTGVAIDLGIILLGMIIPFWAVLGTFFAICLTVILNPILHNLGVLSAWQPGMNAVNTIFANEVDFWLSFSIGASLGLLTLSLYQSVRDMRAKMKAIREDKRQKKEQGRTDMWAPPRPGRGDYPVWLAGVIYAATSFLLIGVCYALLSQSPFMNSSAMLSVTIFLFVFAFVYTPLISYLNARLLGIAGQTVEIPYVAETAYILSGARGIAIWMAPRPIENHGFQAQAFRVTELTETKFTSLMKTELVAFPMLLILSFGFWAFIWKSAEVPSAGFPYAQTYWELQSKRMALQWSATHVTSDEEKVDFWQTEFGRAIHPKVMGGGFATTVGLFTLLSAFGLPVMFVYGMIKGFGQFPHIMVLEIVGALLGRYYFRKKFGEKEFLRMAPTVLAGYFTGVGLIGMATIALDLIQKSISAAPF